MGLPFCLDSLLVSQSSMSKWKQSHCYGRCRYLQHRSRGVISDRRTLSPGQSIYYVARQFTANVTLYQNLGSLCRPSSKPTATGHLTHCCDRDHASPEPLALEGQQRVRLANVARRR